MQLKYCALSCYTKIFIIYFVCYTERKTANQAHALSNQLQNSSNVKLQ